MRKTIKIEGMMCMHCVKHVTKALETVDGVTEVKVSLEEKSAQVLVDNVEEETLVNAVKEAGYEVLEII